ncbi:MAG TPA: ATP-binding cassette domain-containing protein [Hyphomicrobiales bacterium]|nr:ATP-binding cassette domain-containing protein [Hyphomicrobiales bacterium]
MTAARRLGAAGLRATLVWQIARAVFRLGFVAALGLFAGRMIADGAFAGGALAGALAALALSGIAGVLADCRVADAEGAVAEGLRATAGRRLVALPARAIGNRPAGALLAGLQRHPDAVAALVVGHAAARAMLAAGPLLAAAAVSAVSWEAAATLLLCLPVMIVFFVLVGGLVRGRAEAQETAFGHLAAQFADRVRALPTVLASHGLATERVKIERRMGAYGAGTMNVLRVAFLNAGIVDFFSALSIAVLAIFLGLGHLGLVQVPGFYGLQLWQSLFILVAAADFFTPFRRYAEQYHAKAEGEAAATALDRLLAEEAGADPDEARRRDLAAALGVVGQALAAEGRQAGLVVISGPSGAGKSTLLRMLAGVEATDRGAPALPQADAAGCDWIATDLYVPAGTLAEAIASPRGPVDRAALARAAAQVGLLDGHLLPGGLDAPVAEGGANLSGGQRLRIGIARALLSDRVILADEPTAKLDPATAEAVRAVLLAQARRRLVVVATHDPALIRAADRHVALPAPPLVERAAA